VSCEEGPSLPAQPHRAVGESWGKAAWLTDVLSADVGCSLTLSPLRLGSRWPGSVRVPTRCVGAAVHVREPQSRLGALSVLQPPVWKAPGVSSQRQLFCASAETNGVAPSDCVCCCLWSGSSLLVLLVVGTTLSAISHCRPLFLH